MAFKEFSDTEDIIARNVSIAWSKRETIWKQMINVLLIVLIFAVFGCLDFATLSFKFERLMTSSYWGQVLTKTVAGMLAYNLGVNLIWDTEVKKDDILRRQILKYEILIAQKDKDFEFFVLRVFNIREKTKAYLTWVNRQIYKLNRKSKAADKLLFSMKDSDPEEKRRNPYCIKRQQWEDMKTDEYIERNIDAIEVRYHPVEPMVFDMEIDGSTKFHGVKTKGSVSGGRTKATSAVAVSAVAVSMFMASFVLTLNDDYFTSQFERFLHYTIKFCEDVMMILWQTTKGMGFARKIISDEMTQPYAGRNKVLMEYVAWRHETGKLDSFAYERVMNRVRAVDDRAPDEMVIEVTPEEFERMKGGK